MELINTVIQVFDRRADQTKGATERKRGVDQIVQGHFNTMKPTGLNLKKN